MRRTDKEITDRRLINSILDEALVMHIAFVDGEWPYLVPVNFGFRNNAIYIHSARDGKKLELLRRNNRVSFQVETGVEIVHKSIPSKCSTHFKSAAGRGRISVVESDDEKRLGLTLLMRHYDRAAGDELDFGPCLDEVCILKIEIESITGKQSLPVHTD